MEKDIFILVKNYAFLFVCPLLSHHNSFGVFDNSKLMVAQFAQLAKLAQLVQMAQLA